MIKLDAMENPYGLSGEARAEIAAAVANARINRYPDGGGDEVKAALRRSLCAAARRRRSCSATGPTSCCRC